MSLLCCIHGAACPPFFLSWSALKGGYLCLCPMILTRVGDPWDRGYVWFILSSFFSIGLVTEWPLIFSNLFNSYMCLHIFLLLFPFLWVAFFFFPIVVFKFDQKRKKKKKEGKERTNIRTQAGRNKWEKKAVEKIENEERMQCMWKIGHCLFAQYSFNWNICILGLWKERTWFHMCNVKLIQHCARQGLSRFLFLSKLFSVGDERLYMELQK